MSYRRRALIRVLFFLAVILAWVIQERQMNTPWGVLAITVILSLLAVALGIWLGYKILQKTESRKPKQDGSDSLALQQK